MTQDQEIKEAVEALKLETEKCHAGLLKCELLEKFQVLGKLGERYLSCSSMMPSKKEVGEKGLTMSDDQLNIEDAVKYFNGELREAQVTEIYAKPLVDLAQRYLSAKCPEKKEMTKSELIFFKRRNDEITTDEFNGIYKNGYNQAIDDYRLWLMKRLEGLDANFFKQVMDKEGIRNNGENDGYIHTYSDLCSCGKCHMSYLFSSAIQQYFQSYLKGSGRENLNPNKQRWCLTLTNERLL